MFSAVKLFAGDGKYRFAPRGRSFWGGRIQTNFGIEYSLAVVYPTNYPHGTIKAFVLELMNETTPHKYCDGHMCLYQRSRRRQRRHRQADHSSNNHSSLEVLTNTSRIAYSRDNYGWDYLGGRHKHQKTFGSLTQHTLMLNRSNDGEIQPVIYAMIMTCYHSSI